MRYVGVRDNRICAVSDKPFTTAGMQTIQVSDESVTTDDILCGYRIRGDGLVARWGPHEPSKMRLALVGNWKLACGISTYAENLWPEVARHVPDVRIFAEENPRPTSDPLDLGGRHLAPEQVEWCWKRGEPLGNLVAAIDRYDPDVVWIQHEWGLFPDARHWLAFLSRMSTRRVIVTMHSVFPTHFDKTICEAATPEIVVHLDGAREALLKKGVSSKVHVIPHGCYPCTSRDRLWNLYRSERTILQFGFGFRYKGWENALHAVAQLRRQYPDVFFTGLFSESPFARVEHERYYVELAGLVESLGIADHVGFVRGYQSDAVIDAYLRTSRVSLFPYVAHPEHEVFGASGAARMAMAKGVPVVTSSVNHFADLPTLRGDTAEELVVAIGGLFASREAVDKQLQRQFDFIESNRWSRIAERYLELFRAPR